MSTEIVGLVLDDFDESRLRAMAGDSVALAAALHTAVYVAELVKFKLISAPTIFGLLKQLIDDFANVHVYLVCALLDGCGKFLYGEALMSYSYASDSCISHASITVRRVGSNSRNPRTM